MPRVAKKRRKPPPPQKRKTRRRPDPEQVSDAYWDVTHRPLQCLVFLLPMVLVYEFGMAFKYGGRRLAAEQLLNWFFSLFGASGFYLPGAVLVVVLLVWHFAGNYPWKVAPQPLLGMAGESILLAVPLLVLHRFIDDGLQASLIETSTAWDELLLSIGAGIYEELVFRLIVISLITLLLIDIFGMKQVFGVALAVIVSSILFGWHHHEPIGNEEWSTGKFAFRTAAGAYLAAVFVLRGFGLAVGCHIIYDVIAFVHNSAD